MQQCKEREPANYEHSAKDHFEMPITFPQPSSQYSGPYLGQQSNRLPNNCHSCGFQNLEVDIRCQKCGRRLHSQDAGKDAVPVVQPVAQLQQEARQPVLDTPAVVVPIRPAMPEHVRTEIHSRVEKFKARRRGQTLPLPFVEPVLQAEEKVFPFPTLEEEPPARGTRNRTAPRETPVAQLTDPPAPPAVETIALVESSPEVAPSPIPDVQLAESWPPVQESPERDSPPPIIQVPLFEPPSDPVRPQWQMFQIATLAKRVQGIGHDLGYLSMGLLLFAAPFYWIAGAPHLTAKLFAGFLGATLLITLLYGFLFLGVFGETPGMTASGLRVVSFSGQPATFQQRLLRVMGALVSSGSLLCGYLWALIDEEKLYWHDHISKTVLTDSPE